MWKHACLDWRIVGVLLPYVPEMVPRKSEGLSCHTWHPALIAAIVPQEC